MISCKSNEHKVVESMIDNYNKSHISSPYVTKVFANEYSKIGGDYTSFNDGVYYFLYFGDDYEITIANYKLISDNIRKLDSKDYYKAYIKNIVDNYTISNDNYVNVYNISETSDIPFNQYAYSILRRLEAYGVLSKKEYKEFNYKIEEPNDSLIYISFEPKNPKEISLNGVVVCESNTFDIKNIYLNASTFDNINYDWNDADYDISFNKGKLSCINMKSNISGVEVVRNLTFIDDSAVEIDISKFNIGRLAYFLDNQLIIYNGDEFNKYSKYFDKDYSLIFESFGGASSVEEMFMENNNKLFIYKNFQNKTEGYEKRLFYADSSARSMLDSIYSGSRASYKYLTDFNF